MKEHARRYFFGGCAVGLGAWEALAFLGRLPTVTSFVRAGRGRRLLAALWLAGLSRHLCQSQKDLETSRK